MTVTLNLLRERAAGGEVLVGVVPPFATPETVEFLGLLGFDWILLDGEHGPLGFETCYSLVRAADAVGLATVVRAPANEPWLVLGYAESGADAVLVPHVTTAAEGKRLVDSIRYAPHGSRGAMSGSRAANYGLTQSSADYFGAHESHASPMAMIEDLAALTNLQEIAATPGLDSFLIGPGDLAMSMGKPGAFDDPDVRSEVHRAARVLSSAGKLVGTVVGDPGSAKDAIDAGVRLIAVGAGGIMARSLRTVISEIRRGSAD
jgi:2-keto-3-deoxy-L-rhamnonate aldolase RhmA